MRLPSKAILKKYASLALWCLVAGLSLLTAGEVWAQSTGDGAAPAVTGLTAGRAKSIAGGIIALISIIMGWRARAGANRPAAGNTGSKRTLAIVALLLGAIAIVLSVLHLSTSAGAVLGSGSGKAGAIVSLVLALAGMALSALALRPARG